MIVLASDGLPLSAILEAVNAHLLDQYRERMRAVGRENDQLRDHLAFLDKMGVGTEPAELDEPVSRAVDPLEGLPLLTGGGFG